MSIKITEKKVRKKKYRDHEKLRHGSTRLKDIAMTLDATLDNQSSASGHQTVIPLLRGLYFERLKASGLDYNQISELTRGKYTALQVKGMIQNARPWGALEHSFNTNALFYTQLENSVLEILQERLLTNSFEDVPTKDLVAVLKSLHSMRRLETGQSTENKAVLVSVLDKLPTHSKTGSIIKEVEQSSKVLDHEK